MASDQAGEPSGSYGFVAAGLLLLVLAPASRGVQKKCRARRQQRAAQAAITLAAAATDPTRKAETAGPEAASATAPDREKDAPQPPSASPRLSQASVAALPGSPRQSSLAASSASSSSTRRNSLGALPAAWESARRSRTYSELSDSLLHEESPDASADPPRVSFTAEPMNTYV